LSREFLRRRIAEIAVWPFFIAIPSPSFNLILGIIRA